MKAISWIFLFLLTACSSLPFSSAGKFHSDIEQAFGEAASAGKPMLISFSAIWCPPCNQLKEIVFESSQFIKQSNTFVLLNVDADAKTAWKLKDKYKVGGYPTTIFTNSKGEEVYRVVGYREPRQFVSIMNLVKTTGAQSLEKACARKDEDSLWQCASVSRERGDHQRARKAFLALENRLQPNTYRDDEARTYFAENSETKEVKRLSYERLLKKSPESPMASLWALSYLNLLVDSKKEPDESLIKGVLSNFNQAIKDTRKEEAGLTNSDLFQIKAMLQTQIGLQAEAKKSWNQAAEYLGKLAEDFPSGTAARAFAMERIYCLKSAGRTDEALAIAADFQAKYPEEFTFHYVAARLKDSQKKFSEALKLALKALDLSYGDNRIRVATLVLELNGKLKQGGLLKQYYDKIMNEYQIDENLHVRTHRYLKQLKRAYQKAIEQAS